MSVGTVCVSAPPCNTVDEGNIEQRGDVPATIKADDVGTVIIICDACIGSTRSPVCSSEIDTWRMETVSKECFRCDQHVLVGNYWVLFWLYSCAFV